MENIKMVVYGCDDTNVLVDRYRTTKEHFSYFAENGIELIKGKMSEIEMMLGGTEKIDILVIDYQSPMHHNRRPELLVEFRKNHPETKVVLYDVNKPEPKDASLYEAFCKSEYTDSPSCGSVMADMLKRLGIIDEEQGRVLSWNAP